MFTANYKVKSTEPETEILIKYSDTTEYARKKGTLIIIKAMLLSVIKHTLYAIDMVNCWSPSTDTDTGYSRV